MVSPLDMSAVDLARRIAARELSAREIVAAYLDRLAEVEPSLNAVVSLRAEAALADAKAADEEPPRGPLHGVPFTVKDWIDAAGLPCAGGREAHRDRMPARDATAVARLRAAGGILLGKTAAGPDNPVYGRTNNPHDPRYSPAGSSSGEAAVVAAGGSPLGLGSDSGGSIRQPAHCCGIAGLRPTTGRVPLTGHFPFICATTDPRTVIGPLARHVADLALALRVIAGPDGTDPSAVPVPVPPADADLTGVRVAVYVDHPDASPDPAVVAATHAAAAALGAAGLSVVDATPPGLDAVYPLTLDYWRRPESESPDEWVDGGGFDPAGLTGYPAVVVRAGTTVDGLPVGVQIAAAPWREDLALAAASIVERWWGSSTADG